MTEIINSVNEHLLNAINSFFSIINFIKDFIMDTLNVLPSELKISMCVIIPILLVVFIYRFLR